jgi:predicted DNA-binding transcriptional regulator AlpA
MEKGQAARMKSRKAIMKVMYGKAKDPIRGALMMTIQDVADAMKCSDRHITNLRNEGRMPPPVKLGTSVRWPRRVIEDWINANCPALAV